MDGKEEIFYSVCEDALEKLRLSGPMALSEFWDYLEFIKGKYSFCGERSLNPVWWILTDTHRKNNKFIRYADCNIVSGTVKISMLRGKEFAEIAEEYAKDFCIRAAIGAPAETKIRETISDKYLS